MINGGLDRFEIKLDNPTATYAPGEIITGQVILDLSKTKSLRALKLRFKGKCEIRWNESRGSGKDSRTTYYNGDEVYFRADLCLFGNPDGNSIEMTTGHHVFPFTHALRRDIPNSFEHNIGNVRYSIKAIFDRPWKFDHEVTKIFTIESPLELDQQSQAMIGIDDEEVSSFCCFPICISQGDMTVRFRLPKTAYAVGDSIEMTVNINNNSNSVDVTSIKLKLEQKLEFHAQAPYGKTKSDTRIVQNTKKPGPFRKKAEIIVGLQVPSVPHSFLKYCNLIDINYELDIIVSVTGCHCATEKRYDVVIGQQEMSGTMRQNFNQPSPSFNYVPPPIGPSAPAEIYPNEIASAPYPMPVPMMSPNTEKAPDNTALPHPSFPMPGNLPYPPEQPTAGCPYPTAGGYQQPQNIGFVYPGPSADSGSELPPPPSYESVMAANMQK